MDITINMGPYKPCATFCWFRETEHRFALSIRLFDGLLKCIFWLDFPWFISIYYSKIHFLFFLFNPFNPHKFICDKYSCFQGRMTIYSFRRFSLFSCKLAQFAIGPVQACIVRGRKIRKSSISVLPSEFKEVFNYFTSLRVWKVLYSHVSVP